MSEHSNWIDVIMPVYNAESTLNAAIASIIQQSIKAWKLWLVDDGSTDASSLLIEAATSRDTRIERLKVKRNLGPGGAMNFGALVSSAPYIAVMHSDDLCAPHRLEAQLQFLEKAPDVDVVGAGALYVNSSQQPVAVVQPPELHADIVERLLYQSPFIHPTVMMRRTFLAEAGGYRHRRRTEDIDLWIRGASGHTYHNLQDVLLAYSMPSSSSRATITEGMSARWDARRHGASITTAAKTALRFGVGGVLSRWGHEGKWLKDSTSDPSKFEHLFPLGS